MENNKINLTNLSNNTDFAIDLAKFKMLSEFLSNAMIYKYQNNMNLTDEEDTKINNNVKEFCKIIDDYLKG